MNSYKYYIHDNSLYKRIIKADPINKRAFMIAWSNSDENSFKLTSEEKIFPFSVIFSKHTIEISKELLIEYLPEYKEEDLSDKIEDLINKLKKHDI